jgi:hypothetical protein
MKFTNLLKAGVFTFSAVASTIAAAVPITFDFSNGRSDANATYHNNLALSQDGLNLNVTAWTEGLLLTTQGQVSRTANGLGVKGGSSNTQVDGTLLRDEILRFDFSQEVEIESISFMFFDGDDQAEIYDYDARFFWDSYVETISKNETVTSNGISTFTFSDNFFTSLLGVIASDLTDNFTVRSLTVNTKTPATTAAVPEPSVVALLGIGMLVLGFVRRRTAA